MEAFPIDILDTTNSFIVIMDVPGVLPEDLEISGDEKTIYIKGIRRNLKIKGFLHIERFSGRFSRRIKLPQTINLEKSVAKLENGVLYIETPALIKNTPEGAREYIVPSRHSHGKAYVLPQSPQQLKQILMVSGFDRYVQLARCFRDEDLRGDRQPEFTQIDLEMSFVEQEDVLNILEDLFIHLSQTLYPSRPLVFKPFKRMSFNEAMDKYGIDKPELRTEQLQLQDITDIMAQTDLQVFKKIIENNGVAKAIVVHKIYTR